MRDITANWRFAMDHMTFTDAEIELNVGGGLSREATKTVYKDLKRSKEQRMVTSMVNGYEEALFKPTHGTNLQEMESSTGKIPYSIPAFITEKCIQTSLDGGGAAGLRGGVNINSTSETNILGIAPGTSGGEQRWSNEVVFYDTSAALGINSAGTQIGTETLCSNVPRSPSMPPATPAVGPSTPSPLLMRLASNSFDEMYRLQFRPPACFEQYLRTSCSTSEILCSREGINLYKQALRSENTTFPQDVA